MHHRSLCHKPDVLPPLFPCSLPPQPRAARYFGKNGWPHSVLFSEPPTSEEDRTQLIDALQVTLTVRVLPQAGEVLLCHRKGPVTR